MSARFHRKILFSEPGTYRLKILGRVQPDLWNYFEGQTDNEVINAHGQIMTTLYLHVRDQVELSGFINLIHDSRFVLLSMKMTDDLSNAAR